MVAAPPQHGKTELTIHALAWAHHKIPGRRHAYATYAQERSERVANKARLVADRSGIHIDGPSNYWQDSAGSTVIWTSVKGPLTGEPVDGLLIIDDPTKDRKDAESGVRRADQLDWFDDVAEPRCHQSASIIIMATRWHPDDLSGQLIRRGWQYINLQALADGDTDEDGRVVDDPLRRLPGEPLCEARKTRADLEAKRSTNAYTFASLYQGQPRPRGGTLFGEPHYYDTLPTRGYRVGYGIDLAYSEKKSADWSVLIQAYRVDERIGAQVETTFYIVDVIRKQVDAPSFLSSIKATHDARPGPLLWIASGTEKGTAQFVRKHVPVRVKTASEDKFQRALPAAEAWNAGRILVPSPSLGAEWVDGLLDEVCNFTGVKDAHDDQVDALAAAVLALKFGPEVNAGRAGRYDSPMVEQASTERVTPADHGNSGRVTRHDSPMNF